jgi:hypothetical protein
MVQVFEKWKPAMPLPKEIWKRYRTADQQPNPQPRIGEALALLSERQPNQYADDEKENRVFCL